MGFGNWEFVLIVLDSSSLCHFVNFFLSITLEFGYCELGWFVTSMLWWEEKLWLLMGIGKYIDSVFFQHNDEC